jgi:hypothetical protein
MLKLENKTIDEAALMDKTDEQKRQIDEILVMYAQKTITANEMEWQIRRIIQWNVYCNVNGGLRFGQEFLQQ